MKENVIKEMFQYTIEDLQHKKEALRIREIDYLFEEIIADLQCYYGDIININQSFSRQIDNNFELKRKIPLLKQNKNAELEEYLRNRDVPIKENRFEQIDKILEEILGDKIDNLIDVEKLYSQLDLPIKTSMNNIDVDLQILQLHKDILEIIVLFSTSYYSETTNKKKKEHIKSLIKSTIASLPIIGLKAAIAIEIENQLKIIVDSYLIEAGNEVERIRQFNISLKANGILINYLKDINTHLSQIDNSKIIENIESQLDQIGRMWKKNCG